MTAATLAGTARISEIGQILNANLTNDPLADLINAANPVQAWQDTPIGSKRILIDRLMTVTTLTMGRAGRGFDRSSVRIDPKHPWALRADPRTADSIPTTFAVGWSEVDRLQRGEASNPSPTETPLRSGTGRWGAAGYG